MAWSKQSRHARGYGTAWDKLRKLVLRRDCYLCQCKHCKAKHRTLSATEVDHVISKAEAKRRGWTQRQTDNPNNLAAINAYCHKRKTAAEQGRTLIDKPMIGADGYPIKSNESTR
jgi:5-methylcytosine-specific restriction protein A